MTMIQSLQTTIKTQSEQIATLQRDMISSDSFVDAFIKYSGGPSPTFPVDYEDSSRSELQVAHRRWYSFLHERRAVQERDESRRRWQWWQWWWWWSAHARLTALRTHAASSTCARAHVAADRSWRRRHPRGRERHVRHGDGRRQSVWPVVSVQLGRECDKNDGTWCDACTHRMSFRDRTTTTTNIDE